MSDYEATRSRIARAIRGPALAQRNSEVPHAFYEMADRVLASLSEDGFYKRFIAEMDSITIGANDSAVSVVGECTRAAKRAEMALTNPPSRVMASDASMPPAADVEHKPELRCSCGEIWPCSTIPFKTICQRCKNIIEPGTRHNMFNGNQMFACQVVPDTSSPCEVCEDTPCQCIQPPVDGWNNIKVERIE